MEAIAEAQNLPRGRISITGLCKGALAEIEGLERELADQKAKQVALVEEVNRLEGIRANYILPAQSHERMAIALEKIAAGLPRKKETCLKTCLLFNREGG
jgi:hypothetical protein